jgi:spore maturation protein CgeB
MKVLVVADWHGEMYAETFFHTFKKLGYETLKFSWKEYFKHYQYSNNYKTDKNIVKSIYYKFQNKFIFGPSILKINNDLIKLSLREKPNLIFIYRGTHIHAKTLKYIKENIKCEIVGYNNDDPFSNQYPKYFWRHFMKSIPFYDYIFSYRWKNINDYKALNYTKTSLLRSYYIKEKNFFLEKISNKNYICDVIFIGHFEDDGRDEYIKLLFENNISIKIFGTGWEKSKYFLFFKEKQNSIKPLYSDYNLALNSAKIALIFLSKLNNDTYTRRCFEIPITRTMMISEYTEDLNNLFRDGIEAVYFRNKEELLKKVKYFLNNQNELKKIAHNGYERLLSDGHEVEDRVKEIIKILKVKEY